MPEKTIVKTFKYRIYPKKSQARKMELWFKFCGLIYNFFIEYAERMYRKENKNLFLYDFTTIVPLIRRESEGIRNMYSTILYDVARRVSLSYENFFRRWRRGEKNNHPPKTHDINRNFDFTYPGARGFKIKGRYLWLSKIGDVKIILHRPLEGKVKSCTIKKYPTGKWFALFICELPAPELREGKNSVGIDLGINYFATLSDGTKISNPRFQRRSQKQLTKAQRKLAKTSKDSPEYTKRLKIVAKVRAKISNQRRNFFHSVSKNILERFDIVGVEGLRIHTMQRNHKLAGSITDASWGIFLKILESKAKEMGARFVKIDPANTSKTCSSCGTITDLKLGEQIFECPACGLILDRDYNAALNIKRLATQSLGEIPKSPKGSVDVPCSVLSSRKKDGNTIEKKAKPSKEKAKKGKEGKKKVNSKKSPDKGIDREITEQLIIYILANYEEKTQLTEKVLRNLVYCCDLNYHQMYGETITKSRYTKTERRVLNPGLSSVITDLQKNKIIKRNFNTSSNGKLINVYYTSAFPFCPSAFTDEQRRIIDDTIRQHVSSRQ